MGSGTSNYLYFLTPHPHFMLTSGTRVGNFDLKPQVSSSSNHLPALPSATTEEIKAMMKN